MPTERPRDGAEVTLEPVAGWAPEACIAAPGLLHRLTLRGRRQPAAGDLPGKQLKTVKRASATARLVGHDRALLVNHAQRPAASLPDQD
jgi:hypothetical protein